MVSRRADSWLLHDSGHHRAPADAVLPSLDSSGLCGHERPGVRCLLRVHAAQPASMVGACHGFSGFHAHGQGVLSQRLQASARIELDRRRSSAVGHAAAELYRLSAAVGPAVVLGHDGWRQHYLFHPHRGRQPSLLSPRRPHRKCERVAPVLCVARDDVSTASHRADLDSPMATA
jgi:hypothetical protein